MLARHALERERQHVAIAHEARDVQVARPRVHRLRRRDLLHHALLHHDDPVGHRQRLVLVVRHVDRRAFELRVDAADLRAHLDAQLGVEVRQRFVHQHEQRLDHDRARDRDALLLAARQLAGQLAFMADELHELERRLRAPAGFLPRHAAHLQAEADVVEHRHVREQRVVLEHHPEAAALGRQHIDARVVEPDAAARQRLQARDAVERGRLAAAGRAEQRDELAAPDVEIEPAQRGNLRAFRVGEAAGYRVEAQLFESVLHHVFLTASDGAGAGVPALSCRSGAALQRVFRSHAEQAGSRCRRYFDFCAPISRSHFWNAATIACALSGCTCGRSASSFAYSGRPNFLITSWLCAGAISSVTPFTAGPG